MHAPVFRALCVVLAVASAWIGLPPGVVGALAQTRPAAPQGDGEALFRAVFFLEGPLAEEIPELNRLKSLEALRRLTPRQQQAVRAFQSRLVEEIRKARPKFFQEFERDIRSGDRARISRTLGAASRLSKDVVRKSDPAAARFLDRHETSLRKSLAPAARSAARSGPPDLRAIQRAAPQPTSRDAERVELTWLKGFSIGGQAASDPKPDTDHNIAIALLTFIALFVIVVVALPIVSPDGGGLYHEQLVGSLATRVRGQQ